MYINRNYYVRFGSSNEDPVLSCPSIDDMRMDAAARRVQSLTKHAVLKTRAEKVEELRTTSWWLPQFQPEAPEAVVKAVSWCVLSREASQDI